MVRVASAARHPSIIRDQRWPLLQILRVAPKHTQAIGCYAGRCRHQARDGRGSRQALRQALSFLDGPGRRGRCLKPGSLRTDCGGGSATSMPCDRRTREHRRLLVFLFDLSQ